jgi:hypothetical protein
VGVGLAGCRTPSNWCRVSCGFGIVLTSVVCLCQFTGQSFCSFVEWNDFILLETGAKYHLSSAHC